jgi:hypothetical protein
MELNSLKCDNLLDLQIERLAIVNDVPIEDYEELTITELGERLHEISFLSKEPSEVVRKEINDLTYSGFDSLKLGEYIDIDTFLSMDMYNNFPLLLAVTYKRTKLNEWGVVIAEPYTYDIKQRSKLFLDLPITDVYGVLKEWVKYKENIIASYPLLLDTPVTDEEIEQSGEEDKEDIKKEKEQQAFAWEATIFKLCGDDITKFDAVTDLPFIFVMNMLSMRNSLSL